MTARRTASKPHTATTLAATLLLALVIVSAAGCSAIEDFSKYTFTDKDAGGGRADAGVSTSRSDGGGSAAGPTSSKPQGRTTFIQTGGGAVIVTPEHQLSVSVGAPQPMGERSSASQRLIAGPGSSQ